MNASVRRRVEAAVVLATVCLVGVGLSGARDREAAAKLRRYAWDSQIGAPSEALSRMLGADVRDGAPPSAYDGPLRWASTVVGVPPGTVWTAGLEDGAVRARAAGLSLRDRRTLSGLAAAPAPPDLEHRAGFSCGLRLFRVNGAEGAGECGADNTVEMAWAPLLR